MMRNFAMAVTITFAASTVVNYSDYSDFATINSFGINLSL